MGHDSERKYNWKNYGHKGRVRTFAAILILSFLILFLVALSARLVITIRVSMVDSVSAFVTDTSSFMVSEVTGRLNKLDALLETLGDDVAPFVESGDDGKVIDILSNVSSVSNNMGYVVIKNDGTWLSDSPVSMQISEIKMRLEDDTDGILFLSDGSTFSYVEVDRDGGVLGCMKDVSQTRNFLIPSAVSGTDTHGTVISDLSGNVLVTDMSSERIYSSSLYSLNGERIIKLMDAVSSGESGSAFLRREGGDIAVTYYQMEGYDLVFISAFGASVFGDGSDSCFAALALICILIVLLFILLVMTVMRMVKSRTDAVTEAAFIDPVTGGLNMPGLLFQSEVVIDRSIEYVLVLISLRDYTVSAGRRDSGALNRLLKITMDSMLNHTASDELVCRTFGERFLLMLRSCAPDMLENRIRMMAQTTENDYNRNMSEADKLTVTFACGVYTLSKGEDIAIAAEKVRIVNDLAFHEDAVGTVFAYHDENLMMELEREKEISDSFAFAMESRQFVVWYQPKVDSLTGLTMGAEALVRWNKDGVIMTPSRFIPVFEKNGYIRALDMYVLGEVCSQLRTSFARGEKVVPVSVNLSRRHFSEHGIADEIESIRKNHGIPSSLIEIEITESIFLDRKTIQIVRDELEKLHDYGFRCSLDDFGAGYSSLGLLTDFAIDSLKIDKSFMDGIFSEKTRLVVRSIINLASSLSIDVVAEGVETCEQLEILKELGGRTVQGYVYSQPLCYDDWRAWLDKFGGAEPIPLLK
ncbi:MAG: EAL domain-containing protein [Bullifex sp.]